MKVIQMTNNLNHLYTEGMGTTVTLCGWKSFRAKHEVADGEVTCPDCLRLLAAARPAIMAEVIPSTALYFHTDYGNDDACDTLLAVFTDPADAERECAKLTASIPHYDRSVHSYKTESCTVLPKGATYNGGRYGD